LGDLVEAADVIVIGTDSAIERVGPWEVADFKVEEVLKGPALVQLRYLASPTWVCDVASAKPGERVLLLLSLPKSVRQGRHGPPMTLREEPVYEISFAGRGRMPIDEVDGDLHATVWTVDVILPSGTPMSPGPEPEYDFIRRVPLAVLRGAIVRRAAP
jgi:hypothetical protein